MPNQVLEGQLPAPLGFSAAGTPTANGISFDNPGRFPAPNPNFDNPPPPPPQPGVLTQPGAYDSYWSSIAQPAFSAPGRTEQSYGTTAQGYRDLMGQQGPMYAQNAYGSLMPGAADLSAYYDRAWETGSNRLNNEFAARGGYNSSAATQQLSDLAGNLGAQEARDRAQYGLDRARTGGALASMASGEAMGNLGRQESLLSSVFDTAQEADAAERARLVTGLSGAQTAQNFRNEQEQQRFDNSMRYSSNLADVFSSGVFAALVADLEAMGMPHELAVAIAKFKVDAAQAQAQGTRDTFGTVLNFLG